MANKLIERWKAPTPDFFKKVIWIGLSISGISTGLITLLASLNLAIPDVVYTILTSATALGIGMAKVGKFAVDQDKMIDEQKDKVFGTKK